MAPAGDFILFLIYAQNAATESPQTPASQIPDSYMSVALRKGQPGQAAQST